MNNEPITLRPLPIIMDEEDAIAADAAAAEERLSAYREASERGIDFFQKWAMAIKSFKGSRDFAIDCGFLALGWTRMLGVDSQVKLAERWKCEKENVRKLVNHIQKLCGAPPTPNQRSEEGRQKMAVTRRQNRDRKKV